MLAKRISRFPERDGDERVVTGDTEAHCRQSRNFKVRMSLGDEAVARERGRAQMRRSNELHRELNMVESGRKSDRFEVVAAEAVLGGARSTGESSSTRRGAPGTRPMPRQFRAHIAGLDRTRRLPRPLWCCAEIDAVTKLFQRLGEWRTADWGALRVSATGDQYALMTPCENCMMWLTERSRRSYGFSDELLRALGVTQELQQVPDFLSTQAFPPLGGASKL